MTEDIRKLTTKAVRNRLHWTLQDLAKALEHIRNLEAPIPMRLTCPACNTLHIDEGEFKTKPHHTHACQECGMVWRPALQPTVGVRFLPGFKNKDPF